MRIASDTCGPSLQNISSLDRVLLQRGTKIEKVTWVCKEPSLRCEGFGDSQAVYLLNASSPSGKKTRTGISFNPHKPEQKRGTQAVVRRDWMLLEKEVKHPCHRYRPQHCSQ